MTIITIACFAAVGLHGMVAAVHEHMGAPGVNPFANPAFGWSFIFWQILMWLAALTAFAPVTVRAFAAESAEMAGRVFTWTGVLNLARGVLPIFWGIAALAYFAGKIPVSIHALPLLIGAVLRPGLLGLVVVGLLAGTMSTYAGYLIAWGSVISQDIVLTIATRPCTDRARLTINRIAVLVLALFVVCWGLWYKVPGAVFFYLYITGNIFLSGSFWIVAGGLYWKRANAVGAYSALILGAATSLLYFVVPHPDEWAGRLGFLAFLAGFIGMVGGSLLGAYYRQLRHRIVWGIAAAVLAVVAFILRHRLPHFGTWPDLWVAVLGITIVTFVAFSVYALVRGMGDLRRLLRPHTPPQAPTAPPASSPTG
jgi:Na+/proline symporter